MFLQALLDESFKFDAAAGAFILLALDGIAAVVIDDSECSLDSLGMIGHDLFVCSG